MKILYVLKSEPDSIVKKLMDHISKEEEFKSTALYKENVDWSQLVDDIFAYDKVICWW
jgi:hypothetical protein